MKQPPAEQADEHQPLQATDDTPAEAAHSDFAATRPEDDAGQGSDWWPESADGQCSQSAALFAESLPAPLSIV